MDRNKDFENFLGEIMSAEATDIQRPGHGLVQNARDMVLARKRPVKEPLRFWETLFAFFRLDLKFYHVGLSVLLISAGIFYINEPNYNPTDSTGFMQYKEALSITNTTISVNSSTMLTSIPTLVIRN